ncbi:hypothetical protein Back2_09590 [Nocardioides baekrokdamisoli]|uniref:Uncharacterized protein n=1 Tax=Nocardioides baekrokdamisoli TaxID=1804624 RepID=A0A3G9IE87_9ACTN|nr:TetR/AcrR family transcriptional regulator [Nocardioides baekrokdamisoli]BBH16672.1 hypothetical protein Back2_09590 [Nocardioides baekrokdamisoli]
MFPNDLEADMVGRAIETIVLRRGLPAPSFRAIAREANATHSTVASWFGSKDEMLRRCGIEFARRHRDWLSRIAADGDLEAVAAPETAASDGVRVRSMWIGWARTCEGMEIGVRAVHQAEREVLRDALFWRTGSFPDAAEVTLIHRDVIGSWDLGVSLLDLPNVRKECA